MVAIEFLGADTLVGRLKALEQALEPSKVADESGAILLARTRARFLRQEDPQGHTWPVSAAAIRRARQGRGGGTLFDTGRLFHSIQAYHQGPGESEVGTDVPYAAKHQFGIGEAVRQFLGVNQDDLGMITARVLQKISRALEEK